MTEGNSCQDPAHGGWPLAISKLCPQGTPSRCPPVSYKSACLPVQLMGSDPGLCCPLAPARPQGMTSFLVPGDGVGGGVTIVAVFLRAVVLLCRCPQASGPCGCVHLGGQPGEHHLRGVCLPQCHNLMVPRRSTAAKLQLQQHQNLQHPVRQLPGGETWGQRAGWRRHRLRMGRLLATANIFSLASLARPEQGSHWLRKKVSLGPLSLPRARLGPGRQSVPLP